MIGNLENLLWKLKYGIDFNFRCRYTQTIKFLIAKNIAKCKFYELLEVGSGDAGISYFFPNYKNIAVDISFGGDYLINQKKIFASIIDLPFKSESFKFVISVDALEHLSKEHRVVAINEMLRVSNKYLVLTFPCSGLAEEYENRISSLFTRKKKPIPSWLIEHHKYGLPSENEILNLIYSACREIKQVDILPSGGLKAWYIVNSSLSVGKIIYMLNNLIFSIAIMVSAKLLNQAPEYRKTFIVEKISCK